MAIINLTRYNKATIPRIADPEDIYYKEAMEHADSLIESDKSEYNYNAKQKKEIKEFLNKLNVERINIECQQK